MKTFVFLLFLVPCGLLAACSLPQTFTTTNHQALTLKAGDLATHGLAFITPSSVTGQEEDKQGLALVFAEVLARENPRIPCVGLSETLSAINRSGMTEEYKRMFDEYRDTGIFQRETLRKVAQLTNSRFLAQLKLSGFGQGSNERFGAFGLRILETKQASIRLYVQIWDGSDGSIAWEAFQEMNYSFETITDERVTFKMIIEKAATDIIARLP